MLQQQVCQSALTDVHVSSCFQNQVMQDLSFTVTSAGSSSQGGTGVSLSFLAEKDRKADAQTVLESIKLLIITQYCATHVWPSGGGAARQRVCLLIT